MKRVAEVTARIRPHGFFVVETKSKSSYRATPRHAANLMYALMTDAPANSTPEVLKEAESIKSDGLRQDAHDEHDIHDAFSKIFDGKMLNLFKSHNVLDGMAIIIEMAGNDPDLFKSLFVEPLNDGVFEISNYHFCEFSIPFNIDRINHVTGMTIEKKTQADKVIYDFIHIDYEGGLVALKMEKLTRVWLDVFLDIGRVFSNSFIESSEDDV